MNKAAMNIPVLLFMWTAAAAAKSLQSCPTRCDPTDGSLPGSSVHGIFRARGLEWGAIAFSGSCGHIHSFLLHMHLYVKTLNGLHLLVYFHAHPHLFLPVF